jgi:hypothetical protein
LDVNLASTQVSVRDIGPNLCAEDVHVAVFDVCEHSVRVNHSEHATWLTMTFNCVAIGNYRADDHV